VREPTTKPKVVPSRERITYCFGVIFMPNSFAIGGIGPLGTDCACTNGHEWTPATAPKRITSSRPGRLSSGSACVLYGMADFRVARWPGTMGLVWRPYTGAGASRTPMNSSVARTATAMA
jgi:hypothetical protein